MWRHLKKESFWVVLGKRLAVTTVCMAILFCTFMEIWFYAVKERLNYDFTSNFYRWIRTLDEQIEESGGVENMLERDSIAQYRISYLGTLIDYVSACQGIAYGHIKDSATGEILVDSAKKGYLIVRFKSWEDLELMTKEEWEKSAGGEKVGDAEQQVVLECPYEYVREICGQFTGDRVGREMRFTELGMSAYVKVLDFYVKGGGEFRPGKVKLTLRMERERSELGETFTEQIRYVTKEMDCTPENTEGFVHLEVPSGTYGPTLMVAGSEEMDEETVQRAKNGVGLLETYKGGSKADSASKGLFSFYPGQMTFAMSRHYMDLSGKEYDISAYYEIPSFFRDYLPTIRYLALGFVLLSVVISLVWARQTYQTIRAWSAMDNLITNAVRHSSVGGVISVRGTTHGFWIKNSTDIAYRGSLKKLWMPFVRWDESRSGQTGSGLGLSIVDSVFCRHKWKHSLKYDRKNKIFECRIFIL